MRKGEYALKKWIALIAVILVASGAWYFLRGKPQQVYAQAASVAVQKGKLDVNVSGSGSVSPVTSQDVTSSVNKAVDQVLVAVNQEVTAGQQLITFTDGSAPITAPVDGTVTSIQAASGDRLTAGKAVAHITNYKDLQTVIAVDELDVLKVKAGQTAAIKVNAVPDQMYAGKVSAVASEGTISNGVSTFNVTVHIDNPQNLKVGMTTEASILTDSKDNVLYVPIEAVHGQGNKKFVLVKSASYDASKPSVEQRPVQTGIHNESYVEITQGVQEGEQLQLPAVPAGNSANGNGGSMKSGGGMWGAAGGMGRGNGGIGRSGGKGQ